MAEKKNPLPFFAASAKQQEETSIDDEVEAMVQEEVAKTKKISNLRNEKGVDYAPWMKITPEDEEKIRRIVREKAEARRKREEQERSVSGNLFYDSQAQELSGTGLKSKIVDGDVELEWATNQEKNTKGFLVKRRPTGTKEFDIVASFKDWGPLVSQGPEGGVYRYLDTAVEPGEYVYRITECDTAGQESDVCQKVVTVQTPEEQRGAVIAAVAIVLLGVLAVGAGLVLDPLDGY
jgi:rubrerythrin